MGKAYIPSVRKAVEELAFATQGLFGPSVRHTITVRAPISLAVLWLAPRLKTFRVENPGFDVRLVSEIWADSISDQDVDVDIRLGTGIWAGYRAERMASESIVPIYSPRSIDRFRSVADLKQAEMIHILGFEDHWARYFKYANLDYAPDEIGLSVDTSLAAIELVAADGGVALVMKRFVDGLAASGRIGIPMPDEIEIELEQAHYIWESREKPRRSIGVELFRSWLFSLYECDSGAS